MFFSEHANSVCGDIAFGTSHNIASLKYLILFVQLRFKWTVYLTVYNQDLND